MRALILQTDEKSNIVKSRGDYRKSTSSFLIEYMSIDYKQLKTKRLLLNLPCSFDAKPLSGFINNYDVNKYTEFCNKDVSTGFIENLISRKIVSCISNDGNYAWSVFLNDKDEDCIGLICANIENDSLFANIECILNPVYQKSGIMSEALTVVLNYLNDSGIIRVYVDIDSSNLAGIKLAEHIGMQKVCMLKGLYPYDADPERCVNLYEYEIIFSDNLSQENSLNEHSSNKTNHIEIDSIRTERILLSKYRHSFRNGIACVFEDPMGNEYLTGLRAESSEISKMFDEICDNSHDSLHWVAVVDTSVVGYAYAHINRNGKEASIEFRVLSDYWGNHYGTEMAFAIKEFLFAFGIERVYAECDDRNRYGKLALKRSGFLYGGKKGYGKYYKKLNQYADLSCWNAINPHDQQ